MIILYTYLSKYFQLSSTKNSNSKLENVSSKAVYYLNVKLECRK